MIAKALLIPVALLALGQATGAQELSGRSGQPHRLSVRTHLDRGQFDHAFLEGEGARAYEPSVAGAGATADTVPDAAAAAAANPHLFEPGVTLR